MRELPDGFEFPTSYETTPICKGMTIRDIAVTVYYVGEIAFKVTADGGLNWESITLTSGVNTWHSFTNPGNELRFMAIGNPGAYIYASKDVNDRFETPGIRIRIEEITI